MNSRSETGGNRLQRNIEQALREVFLFKQWSDDDLREVATIAAIRDFDRNGTVFHHATPCRHLYVIMHGRIQLSRLTPDGRETVIHVLGPGELLACAALFLDRGYPATARVISPDARLLVLNGAAFLEKLSARSDLSFRVIAALSTRISKLTGRIESRATESAGQRVASWLLGQPEGGRIVLKSTKKVLAEELGMTPETLSRVLAKLRQQGVIEVKRREIDILSPAKLKQLA
jgi:CRP/FNR family transcriptional regulator